VAAGAAAHLRDDGGLPVVAMCGAGLLFVEQAALRLHQDPGTQRFRCAFGIEDHVTASAASSSVSTRAGRSEMMPARAHTAPVR
jgi:23S rRNA G2445 N2-methylase RlmL